MHERIKGVTTNSLRNLAEIGNQPVDGTRRRVAGAGLGQYAPGTRASDGSPVVSLRSTTAIPLQGPESFNSGARLLGKCSVITFAVSSSALARAIPSLTISGGGKGRARWG
jgi:hypothetical protein